MKTIYPFHSFLRRKLGMVEQVITAAGLAVLLYGLMWFIPSYPPDWGIVIVVAVFFLSIGSPVAGYFLAVLAAAYPLYLVSIYLAVVFLAIAVIGQHAFIQNLGGVLMTLAAPLLNAIYLSWTIPVLGGLWWGPAGGALMGGLAALWMELVAGMVYLAPDLLKLIGVLPVLADPVAKFASANSLETFQILFLPLAPDSSTLLYHTLQVALWAFVGWAVGMFNEKDFVQIRRPRSSVFLVGGGILVLGILQVALNLWLGSAISADVQTAIGFTVFFSFIAAVLLEVGQYFIEHPLPAPVQRSAPIQLDVDNTPAAMSVPTLPDAPADDKPDDLIMLELD
ncbi:MAG: hypothetical protein HY865_07575 [Chloroflexi bacterium]|nr:hypothetical protein [Chloroflexota bacterium]